MKHDNIKYRIKDNLIEVLKEKNLEPKWASEIIGKVLVEDKDLRDRMIIQAAFPPFSQYVVGRIKGVDGSFQLPIEALEEIR